MERYISALIISFFIYGFFGWIWESIILPIFSGQKLKNSGFLNGPIVPIYGVGAIVMSLLFSPLEKHLSIFLGAGVVACVIEYVTSWGMEKLYHRRWWDYSDMAFQVNGRICLEGFLIFGVFGVVAVKYIQPYLMHSILRYHTLVLIIASSSLVTILLIDFIATVIALSKFDERLDDFIQEVEDYRQKVSDDLENKRKDFRDVLEIMKNRDFDIYQELKRRRKYIDLRIFKAFPDLINKKKEKR